MNNGAFRALVNETFSGVNSNPTKDIVREAIEVERNLKKHRKRKFKNKNGDDDYGGCSNGDEGNGQRTNGEKSRNLWQGHSSEISQLNKGIRYRDRALERRKHLKGNWKDALEKEADNLKNNLTKNLDGDKEFPHAVRGLDYELSTRDQQEELKMKQFKSEKGTEEVLQEANNQLVAKWKEMGDAELKRRLEKLTSHSELGKCVLNFLKKNFFSKVAIPIPGKLPTFTPAENSIRRSTEIFNLEGNIHDLQDAWEIPATCAFSRRQVNKKNHSCCMMPLDVTLIARIRTATYRQHETFEEVRSGVFVAF